MITLYSGVPGSGKTYKMVAELDREKEKYFVVHNIDGLAPDYLGRFGVNFVDYCKENNLEVTEFFSKECQIEYCAKIKEKYDRPVLCIIDEAHEWFSTNSKTLKMWLSYHRHIDQEIWLVAHRSTNLPAVYRSFIEVEYRAKSGAFMGIPGYFFYNRIVGGVPAGYVKERKLQKTFKIYKSAIASSKVNRKKPKLLIFMIIGVLVLVAAFIALPQIMMSPKAEKVEKNQSKKVPVAAPGSVASVEDIVKKKNLEEKLQSLTLSDKYAYVGNFAGRIVLEDRKTGEHKYIEKMSERLQIVSSSGSDSCVVFTSSGASITLYNEGRYHPAENVTRPLSGAFTAGNQAPADSSGFSSSSLPSSSGGGALADRAGG